MLNIRSYKRSESANGQNFWISFCMIAEVNNKTCFVVAEDSNSIIISISANRIASLKALKFDIMKFRHILTYMNSFNEIPSHDLRVDWVRRLNEVSHSE